MRLKRVKIFGFKTFADRTEFDLQNNLTAVVGPNGCGKSNLVDAILWALGEGNARHLRAQSNQDVIFSGSARRKGVGFAEVTLLFDNEDGALPIQSSEVSVTRRLNRAGESEYFINRQICRLRDVFDLLADSGLGRSGYAIVGQKEIDQALAASPEDRRGWIDEAAGVQRYRARKMESLKRLGSARNHLDRVGDILNELEGQREPLREEAEVALRYKSALNSLRSVESGLLVLEVAKAAREVRDLEAKIANSQQLAGVETGAAEAAEQEARILSEKARSLEAEQERIRDLVRLALTAEERSEAAVKLGEQKLKTLTDLEQNLGEEAEAARRRIGEAETELQLVSVEMEAERSNLERVRQESGGAGEHAEAIRANLAQLERELAIAREIHAKKLRVDAERAHLTLRKNEVVRELKGIDASAPALKKAVEEAAAAEKDAQARLESQEESIRELQVRLAEMEREEAARAAEDRKWLAERASLDGRRQGIEATIEAHEGLQQGAKAVLDACAEGALQAKYTPVGEALEVRKEHALAIEIALGAAANDLICEREEDAKRAIGYLKENRLGRATFQPLPLMRPAASSADLAALLKKPGIVGRASELVQGEHAYRPVFESLLGRVIVVDSLDTALKIAPRAEHRGSVPWNRLVTLEGEVVHAGGAVTGGNSARPGYGLVQRKADLLQLAQDIAALEKAIGTSQRTARELLTNREKLDTELSNARTGMTPLQDALKDSREWLHRVQNEMAGTERSRQKLAAEFESIETHAFEEFGEVDLGGIEQKRDSVLKELAARNADADSASERLHEAESRLKQAETRVEIAGRRLAGARENEALRARRLTNLGPDRSKTMEEIARAEKERREASARKAKCEADLKELQEDRNDVLAKVDSLGNQARAARSAAQHALEDSHQAEISRARLETHRTASVQRMLEEYGISEDEALLKEASIELPSDAASVVSRLRKELKAMGDVNIGAIEAYERLTTRWDELTNQREDIESGIREIEASIRELDKLTRERFQSTFEAVQDAFAEIFARLFGGGEGRIFLTDEQNLLESGVEIDVMLPGKKRQKLELLSGGERSLCAASFLFALLRVKPSPLVVLDEVDAPLDGRNVERFLALLEEFARISQFIVITHNMTTIQTAPAWLGVTMQEPGVSTLVPVRFAREEPLVLN